MAKYNSSNVAFLLIDGYSILGVSTEITIVSPIAVEDVTPLGTAAEVFSSTGMVSSKMSQKGFFDDAAGSSHAALVGRNGTKRIVCYGIESNTIGRNFIGLSGALQTRYNPEIKVGANHRASADYIGSASKEDGKILHAHGAETTATGNTQASSVDNGAATTNGGAGYLEVSAQALGGYTDVRVSILDSADNITFTTLAYFNVTPTAPTAQRVVIAGTIRRYTACLWAFGGAGSGESITFMAGIVRS